MLETLAGDLTVSNVAEDAAGAQLTDYLLHRFDVRHASCYLQSDKHRLLAVVEAAYGDTAQFNRVVQDLFRACLKLSP